MKEHRSVALWDLSTSIFSPGHKTIKKDIDTRSVFANNGLFISMITITF